VTKIEDSFHLGLPLFRSRGIGAPTARDRMAVFAG
jgi:hypothetical protein